MDEALQMNLNSLTVLMNYCMTGEARQGELYDVWEHRNGAEHEQRIASGLNRKAADILIEVTPEWCTRRIEPVEAEDKSKLPSCPKCGNNQRLLPHWSKSNLWVCLPCSEPFDTNNLPQNKLGGDH
ncbi:hypothetical protein D3C81_1076740 [compost metagenome]